MLPESPILFEVVVLLVAAVVIVALFRHLRLSPVLGYLVAGGAIGPHGLAIVTTDMHYLAEFGVVFLLFAIGLELTFERLKSMRRHVFGYGLLQFFITGAILGSVAYLLIQDSAISFIIGGGLALSSTAIVLQLLSEKNMQASQMGRLSLATLILQDLAVVPLLIIVPVLAQSSGNLIPVVLDSIVKAAIALAIISVIGTYLIRPIFNFIAALKSQELFIATILLIVLGTAWSTYSFGLSLALGAFIAGVLVSETQYRHQVEADIQPFKGVLMGLFFMTIGMSINMVVLAEQLPLIVLLTLLLLATKAIIVMGLARLFGFEPVCAFRTGLLLSQGSEFTFALFGLALVHELLAPELHQLLLLVVALSMAMTPLTMMIGDTILRYYTRRTSRATPDNAEHMEQQTKDLDGHIIVIGFDRVGRTICQFLSARNINYVAIDSDPQNVQEGKRKQLPVYYCAHYNTEVLRSLGVERAKMVAIVTSYKRVTKQMLELLRRQWPDLCIIARAHDRMHALQLKEAGATIALPELFESSLLLGRTILRTLGTSDEEIMREVERFRRDEYPTALLNEAKS